MATKWSSISISGYGASSPADDGSATEANKVKYSTIKTDLTNPLNTALSSALTSLTEAFNDGTVAKSGTYSTTATDHARTIECTGTFTLSLLAAATAGAGYRVTVKNAGTGVITVARSSTDTIDGATSVIVPAKEARTFKVNAAGSGYNIDSGVPRILQIVHATDSGSSHSSLTYSNLNGSSVSITPRSATSKLLIEVSGRFRISNVASVNAQGTFSIYESTAGTAISNEYLLETFSASGGSGVGGPFVIRHQEDSSGTSARTFGLQGKVNNASATIVAQQMVWTITEYV